MHMAVLMRFVRVKTASMPEEYFTQLFPSVDRHQSTEQFVVRYRLAHAALAVVAALLLGWLVVYMQRPDWDRRWVVFPVVAYFVSQWLPMFFTAIMGIKHMKALKVFLQHAKRKAVLKRRGLFDFVSPVAVFSAALVYILFVAFVISSQAEVVAALVFIGAVTLEYALSALSIYKMLYGRRSDPFETNEGRLHTIGMRVRSSVYISIAIALFMAFAVAVTLLGLDRWMPFALALLLTLITFITFRVFMGGPRALGMDELGSSEVAS
jgi:hypothetical protein